MRERENPQGPASTTDVQRLLEALGRVNEIGANINRLSRGDQAGVETTLRLIVESAIQVVPDSSAVIYVYDAERGLFDPISRVGAGKLAAVAGPDEPRPGGMGMRAISQRRPVISYDEPDLEIHPAEAAAGAKVVVSLPLVAADGPVGVLYVFLHEERRLSQLELLLLNNFVNQAAVAIDYAGRYGHVRQDLARKSDELSLLRHAGLLISSRSGLEETLQAILQMAMEVTGAKYGIFRLVDRAGRHLVSRAIAGERLGQPAVEVLAVTSTSIMGWVAQARQPVNIADVRLPPWDRLYYPLDHALEMRSELAVPLIGAGGRLEGVLNLESPLVAAFDDDDDHLLQALAAQAVIAIQEARLLDAVQEMAERLLTQSAQEALNRLADIAGELLNTDASVIWVVEGDQLVPRATSGVRVSPTRIPIAACTPGQAVITRRPVVCTDMWAEPCPQLRSLIGEHAWVAGLIVPLLAADRAEPLGAFAAYGAEAETGAFATAGWGQKVLGVLAQHASLAILNENRQEALRAAQEARAIAETFAAMGDIAANLLHHLNNKVGTIPVRVEGIQDKCSSALAANPYLAGNLAEIEQAALGAMQVVRDRLSLLRPIHLSAIDVAACVRDAVASARLPATVTVEIKGLEQLPRVVAGQETLSLVLGNLLENAVEAMDGQGRIAIHGHDRRGAVEVAVSDSGPGIALELQQRIFQFGFTGPRRTDRGGLGFGLWWARTLMARLEGTITVESDGQHGTTFRLELPSAQGDVA